MVACFPQSVFQIGGDVAFVGNERQSLTLFEQRNQGFAVIVGARRQ